MTYKEIIEFVESLKIYKSKIPIYLKNHHENVYNEILSLTKFLDETNPGDKKGVTFQARMYCIRNNIHERPKCPECGEKYLKFKTDENCFAGYCSHKCSKSSLSVKQKREATNLERYGDKHFHNIEKAKQTRLEKYGTWQPESAIIKTKQTLLEKYGDEKYVNWEKMKETNLIRYGVEYALSNKDIQERCRKSFLEKNPGCKSTMDIPGVKEKLKLGNREKSWRFISNNPLVEPMFTHEFYMNVDDITADDALEFKCKTCGTIFKSWWYAGHSKSCPTCFPLGGSSNIEIQVVDFLKSVIPDGYKIYHKTHKNRKLIYPKEIDIIICNENDNPILLIEVDGLFYHSSEYMKKDKKYHLEKTEKCEQMGYKLIHIFENEWVTNQNIVKSRLCNFLGVYEKTIFARKCEIKEVSNNEAEIFIQNNHIQGNVNSSIYIGLFYENELVSIMSFGKCRFSKKYEYELLRFCNKLGHHIPGAASKLLKYFENVYKPHSLVSYADRRWSNGNVYHKLGFTYSHSSEPNYWYFKLRDSSCLFNRMKFQKHKQKKLLKEFDPEKSEIENMVINGYDRIFDCGNLVFVKTY